KNLIGDVLLAAGFLSYAGPFPTLYREQLIMNWFKEINRVVNATKNFKFTKFLANPTDVQEWIIKKLPTDNFSIENGVLVTRGRRWPLLIDPQGQASEWLQQLNEKLEITDL